MEDYSPSMKLFGNFFTNQYEAQTARDKAAQQRAIQAQLQMERGSFTQKMAMAKEQGLHPLSVLGIPTASAPIVSGSQMIGSNAGSGGFDTRRHDVAQPSEYDTRMMEYNERIASANARVAEARAADAERPIAYDSTVAVGRPNSVSNDQIRMQSKLSGVPAKNITFGGNKSLAGTGDAALINIKPDEINASRPNNPGMAAGVAPGFREVRTPDGKTLLVPDQSVIQTEIDEGALYNSLINHGVSPSAALDIVGLKDVILTGFAGVAGVGGLAWKSHSARNAARIAKQANAHRRWKGGE